MLKNLKEKLKKGITKKKIATIAIFAVAVIIAIIAIVVNQSNEQSSKRRKIIADGELARAMTYDQFEDGDEAVNGTDNVKFSAFFLRDVNNDGYAEKIKGTCKQIGKEDTLYMEINVQTDGILKNAKVEIDGKNFYLATTAPKDNELKDNYIGTNVKKLEFNDMTNGTQKIITGAVRSGDYSYASSKASAIGSNINNLSRDDNKVTFTGTYVSSDGNEIQINKEINLQMDWYGSTSASVSTSTSTYNDLENREDEANGTITLTAEIRSQENNNQLLVEKNYVEGTIPQLNGYDPISVTMKSSTDSFSYDETNRKFIATREAVVNENGDITKSISRDNKYTLKIVYPLEAYTSLDTSTLTIDIPVTTYYEGYNNPNAEFTNPYKSNEVRGILSYTFKGIEAGKTKVELKIGEYLTSPANRWAISKKKPLRIYNEASSEETDDNYIVSWYVSKGDEERSDGIIMKERKDGEAIVSDTFVKADATTESMENLTTNIGIGFENADKFLAEDGFIKVYDDETDELLVTFTKTDWGKYTKTSPFKFSMPVKHIRVETSETQASQYLYVYSQKQLDDEYITTNYTKEEFDNLKQIRSNLNVYAGTNLLGDSTSTANYEAPYSVASLSISKNTLSTQITEENEVLTIKATADESANQVAWSNGNFLIKLPTNILDIDIYDIQINNPAVIITSYEKIENDNGKFIKINTQNISNVPQTFEIAVDTDITPDPRIATSTENFELWASNEEGVEYYYNSADIYDVNNNLNTEEKVHKSTIAVKLIAPNSLLTNQTASNFDKDGTQVVSPQIADVKPQLATVSQDTPEKTVRIGAQIKNNYADVITDVMILGKIPFEGNTYVLSGEDLGSEFTTKMTNAGIEISEELKDKVVVYYSENETPDKDLSNAENGWKTAENIANWDNVKTYLIDFQDMEVASGAEYTFYYTIKVPNGEDYNKKSFSHHGVYFALKTSEGKYRTQTEPNKLGIRIAEKYNLELQKYQTGKTNLVPGATYKITKEATDTEDEESKTAVTNAEGKLELQNLYAKRTYSIEEIKTPESYELNTDVIKIIGTIQEDGSLQVEKAQGTTREDIEITKAGEDEPYKVTVKVEDEAKVKLKLTKTEKDTTTPLRGIRYKLTGDGLPENGKNLSTNLNGEIIVKGLTVGEEYTLEETKAEGYYLASPIKFTVTNTDGTYEINVSEGTVKESSVTEEENLPIANIQVEDDKIPTYDLEISKIKRVTSVTGGEDGEQQEETVYLQGAKFKLYKGKKEIGNYITDENGKITISGLYQYIDEKDEEATYTLKETLAPEGYSKVKDITFKVDGTTGELKFINTEGKEEKYTVEGTTVKLTIEDNPSFKLIKKDSETGELLANIKFAIYNIDNDTTTPAKNSKGEIIGTKETINGKEYYTVTTNSNGEITADLPEGMYKAVEVQAPDKYDLSDSTYYFGIGASREGKEGLKAVWAKGIGGTKYDEIGSIVETNDGGYLVGGYFKSASIELGNGISLTNTNVYSIDGMIIKYGNSGEVEWTKVIGGTGDEKINSVSETTDGGYIVGGYFDDRSIDLGNGISLTNTNVRFCDGMIIKYGNSGEVEWAKVIGGTNNDSINSVSETTDGGYIVGGSFKSKSIDLGNGISLSSNGSNDGMIIKYSSSGEVEWAKVIGGTNNDSINSVSETTDGGYIVGGYFYSSSIDLGNGISLTNQSKSTDYTDGMIIKYSSNGETEWAKVIGGTNDDTISSVAESSDGGYIVGGYFKSSSIDLGNGISLSSNGSNDGMIIKYSSNGETEWARVIGGTSNDYIESVSETTDGGYIVGGYFKSSSIDLGNGISLTNQSKSTDYTDGMIIKYSSNGETEWAKGIGGTDFDYINSVSETTDGGYLIGGYFESRSIDLGNGISLSNHAYTNGMIIKYGSSGEVEWAKRIGRKDFTEINSVSETRDGGYIVGGYFTSSIDLENGIWLSNPGSKDGMIIKYGSSGEVKWAKVIGGENYCNIESVSETRDGDYIVRGKFTSSIDLENGVSLSSNGSYDGMILKITDKKSVPEVQELNVENKRKIFKITTDVDEIDGVKGGSISGEDEKIYEMVKYGDNSTKEIKMIPDENYKIVGITVNGKDYNFIANDDGSYTMPTLTNITEDIHIEVTYLVKNNTMVINKIDKKTKEKLSGAQFNLDQIEERAEPNNDEIVGELTDNGQEYTEAILGDEVIDKLGELTNNGTYYFIQNEDGTYTPTNSKTYQTANGGIAGIQNSTANSYIPIDLTDLTGQYAVVVNASCSSEGPDHGYVTITETTTAPSYSSTTGRFMYVSGISDAKDYTSAVLQGGKIYYLHMGYRKDYSGDSNADQIVINSIKLHNATANTITYNFINNNGKYESTNVGKDSTVANSYIPIDLTNCTGKYNLIVNAEVSSESNDCGYVYITENTNRPNGATGRLVYISGTQSAQDYATVLQGGKMYYLHLVYYKGASTSSGDDKFTVNSVNITLNDSELYHTTVETNSFGQAITQIPFGKYSITETKAPDGYWLNEMPTIVEFRSTEGSIHEFTIEDEAKAKLTVHHYIKGTTTRLADDEEMDGHRGEEYKTSPKIDLNKYELETDENGKLVLPDNAIGTYAEEPTEVTYYYVEKKIPLTVHHYIEGTTTQVPLKDGTLAEDVTNSGLEGEEYTTVSIADENLSDEYELVEIPSNANGTYSGAEVIVTYYYKKVSRAVNLVKYQQDGITPLQGAKFTIDGQEYVTDEKGKIQVNLEAGTYEITETEAPEGYKLPENPTTEITITKETTSEDINITNDKKTGTVTVHHYIEGTTDQVSLTDGSVAEDEIKTGTIGDIYATQAREDISEGYELIEEPENASGIYIDGDIEVIYYYRVLPASVLVHHYLEGTTTKLADDETIDGKVGDKYTTSVADVDEMYELVVEPDNKEGNMTKEQIVVTYYYQLKKYPYIVNYLEKDTDKVLHAAKKGDELVYGSAVNSINEKIDIDGYVFDSFDKDVLTIGTENNEINIYYIKRNDLSYTVNYLEKDTNKVLHESKVQGNMTFEDVVKSSDEIIDIYGYKYDSADKDTLIIRTDENVINLYYTKKDAQVIVHYYEENTTKKLSEDVTINGKVDDLYTTVSATDVPIKYELVATPSNANGSMTEDTIEVIYYYRVKDAVVNVRYLEKGTDIELADADRIDGKVEDLYQTSAKNIEGYQLVEHTGNEKGKFEVEPLTITYYYLYKTKATVQYIDKTTGAILEQSTTEGLEGDEFETESKNFENYILVEEPAKKTVKMTKEEQVLKYYYIHVSGGVIEKHIDVISGQILANAVHNGNEGDAYDIPSRTFEGYDLVEDRLPSNAKGTMKVEPVEVIYYYSYRTKVTAEYIDKETGDKLVDDEVQNGHEGDNYTTERKLFDGYKLIEVPANADGSMTKEDIIVKYYYVRTSGGVIVNHLDVKTNKQLLDEAKEEGYEGDPYETHEENISGYDLVKDRYPENATGTMTTETIRVTYYYIKKTEVNVKYVNKETGEEIDVPTNIQGHEGDEYKTEPKDVPGYDLVEEPENKAGTMTAEPIDVIYYYRRPAKVIVNYYDADTKAKLADEVEITGHQGDSYTTEEKDIKYYRVETLPVNKDGKMTVTVTKDENGKDIVEDTTYVNYYYRKLIFNLKVDKIIASVIVNGQETAINGNLGKVEVHRKDISTANVKVVYKIKVTNDSELIGKANVVENIPSGMTMIADNNSGWTINETTASIETDEIKPGESREYQVVLGWQNGDGNIGTKENVASIVTENEAGFNEKDASDNESKADLIVAVGTGEVPYVAIAGSILIIMIAITSSIYVIKKKRQ